MAGRHTEEAFRRAKGAQLQRALLRAGRTNRAQAVAPTDEADHRRQVQPEVEVAEQEDRWGRAEPDGKGQQVFDHQGQRAPAAGSEGREPRRMADGKLPVSLPFLVRVRGGRDGPIDSARPSRVGVARMLSSCWRPIKDFVPRHAAPAVAGAAERGALGGAMVDPPTGQHAALARPVVFLRVDGLREARVAAVVAGQAGLVLQRARQIGEPFKLPGDAVVGCPSPERDARERSLPPHQVDTPQCGEG
eukprot:scaffold9928_cov112-Isochrysis_galbana.AAC.13